MNYQKVGKFIATLRKEKGLTQSKLAELLNVSVKRISRWESGTSSIDMSNLNELSLIFGVSREEILDGGRKVEKVKRDKGTNDYKIINDKSYIMKQKNSIILCFLLIVLSLCFLLIIFVSKSNCDNFSLYSLDGYDDRYHVNGIIVKSSKGNYVIINSVAGDSSIFDEKVYAFQCSLYLGGNIIYKAGDIRDYVYSKNDLSFSLSDKFSNINIYVNNPVDDIIQFSFFKQMYLEVHYVDENLSNKMLVIPIKIIEK